MKGTEPLHITAYIYVVVTAIRTPFQGDFLVRVVPRAEALGCFLFARRALGTRTRKSPNSRPRVSTLGNRPPGRRALKGRQVIVISNRREKHISIGSAIVKLCAGAHY